MLNSKDKNLIRISIKQVFILIINIFWGEVVFFLPFSFEDMLIFEIALTVPIGIDGGHPGDVADEDWFSLRRMLTFKVPDWNFLTTPGPEDDEEEAEAGAKLAEHPLRLFSPAASKLLASLGGFVTSFEAK